MKKRILILLIAGFVVVSASLFMVFYDNAKKTAMDRLHDTQLIHAKQAARGIEDFFTTWTGILDSLSKMDAVIDMDAEGKRDLTLLYEAHREHLRSVTRVDERGKIQYTVPYSRSIGSDISGQEHIREILQDHKPVVSDVFKLVQGFDAIAFHVPVFKGSQFKGTIAAIINFESLAKRYLDVIKIGNTGHAWVIDSKGTMLYSPVPGFTGRSVLETCSAFPSMLSMVQDMLLGHQGSASYTFNYLPKQTASSAMNFAVYMPISIPKTFWSIVVTSSKDEVLSSLASFRNRLALISGMIFVGGVILSWISAKAWLVLAEEKKRRQAEEALRESEKRIHLFFERQIVGMAITSPEKGWLQVNDRLCQMLGRSHEELTGMTWSELTHPDDIRADVAQFDRLLAGEIDEYSLEKRFIRKDSTVVFTDLSVGCVRKSDGAVDYVLALLQDITERKRAEYLLRNSEERFRKAFATSPDAININRLADGRFESINRGFTQTTGYTEEDVAGRTSLELNIWDDPEDRRRLAEGLTDHGEVRNLEAKFRTKEGGIIYGLMSATVISLGGVQHVLSITRDITERKQAEAALRESEQRFRQVVEASPLPIGISTGDGRIEYVNPKFIQLFGYTLDEVAQITDWFRLAYPDPDYRQRIIQQWQSHLERSEREHRVAEPVEAEIHCKDGMVRSSDIFGTVMGDKLMAIFSDLTDRKKAEKEREMLLSDIRQALEAVTRSQKEWQETFDNITDMISIHDKNFNIIRANKAFSENLGLHPRDVIGRKCYELMHHGALSPIAACPHERSLMDRTLAAEEVHDEMTGRTLQVTTYPYVAPDGELIGSIHIARDITEEKEREMKMIMTERLASLGQMASGIAHEINNPLSSVMMCAEMLLMQVAKDRYDHAQFERYLKTIDEEVQRCRDITTSMLSFARQTSMEKQDVDLQLLLDKTVDLVGFQGRLKNVQVVKRYGPKVLVKGSEGELRQVMLVLVVNALDAMKNKGTLTIATERTDEMCRVHVGDSGPGIPEEVRQKIFQPFFTTKTDSGGTGLGLAIAHRIMTNHQGSIEVSSEPGAGATFVVSLPCR